MATRVGWGPRAGQIVSDAALVTRGPARVVFGSLRTAILLLTLGLMVVLMVQLIYLEHGWHFVGTVKPLMLVSMLSNIALIYGTFNNKIDYVYAWMSFSIVRLPLILLCGVAAQYYTIAIGLPLCILHVVLEVMLLALAHGHAYEESCAGCAQGDWLHANMKAKGGPNMLPQPDPQKDLQRSLGEEPYKSLQVYSPAVLAPSTYTTVTPPSALTTSSPNYQC